MSYEPAIVVTAIGNAIRVTHPSIPPNQTTYMSAAISAGGTALTVLDNYPFAQDDLLLIGKLGLDKTEIVRVNVAVAQGTALTLLNTAYDHPIDTPVSKILWNQIEISGAATVGGVKTVITTISIQPDRPDTGYVNTGTTYAFYYVRYKNSVTSAFSSYSSAAPAGGYGTSTVRSVKQEALDMVNEKVDGVLITDQWLYNQIYNCEQEVWSERKKWSWAYQFDCILGQAVEGGLSFTLPANISDANSNKSILEDGIRLGSRPDMSYITKEEWDQFFVESAHTTLAQDLLIGATAICLTSASDFDDSGSIVIGSDSSITYTAKDTALNTLTGVSGVTANHTSGADVWQNAAFMEPVFYTVFNGKLYFQGGVDSTHAGLNCYISYYSKPTAITTDSDTVNIPDFSLYHYYLAWKILLRKNNGQSTDDSEVMFGKFMARKEMLKKQDRTGQYVMMKPRLNRIQFPRTEVKTSFTQVDY